MSITSQVQRLDTLFLQEMEENAVRFARGAGAILLHYFKTPLKVEYKAQGHRDPVTPADRESEDYLRAAIHQVYPGHSILGEEGEDMAGEDPEFTWVLDPLDGTVNYINGLPLFAVSIAALYRGEPVAAAIYAPTSGLLEEGVFHARLGGQAYLNDAPISVASNPFPEPSHLTGLPAQYWRRIRFSGELRRSPGEVRALGSIALELALAACGTLQYAVFDRPKIWDVAAGALLVKGAGGLVLSQSGRGKPWRPLERFEPREEGHTILDGFRKWSAAMVVGNPEIAWTVATSMHRPSRLLRSVGSLLRRARQLSLWGSPRPPRPS